MRSARAGSPSHPSTASRRGGRADRQPQVWLAEQTPPLGQPSWLFRAVANGTKVQGRMPTPARNAEHAGSRGVHKSSGASSQAERGEVWANDWGDRAREAGRSFRRRSNSRGVDCRGQQEASLLSWKSFSHGRSHAERESLRCGGGVGNRDAFEHAQRCRLVVLTRIPSPAPNRRFPRDAPVHLRGRRFWSAAAIRVTMEGTRRSG